MSNKATLHQPNKNNGNKNSTPIINFIRCVSVQCARWPVASYTYTCVCHYVFIRSEIGRYASTLPFSCRIINEKLCFSLAWRLDHLCFLFILIDRPFDVTFGLWTIYSMFDKVFFSDFSCKPMYCMCFENTGKGIFHFRRIQFRRLKSISIFI